MKNVKTWTFILLLYSPQFHQKIKSFKAVHQERQVTSRKIDTPLEMMFENDWRGMTVSKRDVIYEYSICSLWNDKFLP